MLLEALEGDISDVQGGTTAEGVHLGAMAGTLDLLQRGLTGIGWIDGVLRLNPKLPQEPQRARVHPEPPPALRGAGTDQGGPRASHLPTPQTPPITIAHRDQLLELAGGETWEAPLA